MSVLKSLESKIAGLVEGTFSRAFRSEVRPVEIARKLAREMDEHRSPSLNRIYVPNEYTVWLSPDDRERFSDTESALRKELAGYLLEHARGERFSLLSRPAIDFKTDDRLQLGEFGIQARLVDAGENRSEDHRPVQGDAGHTMVYSAAERLSEPLEERARSRQSSAYARVDGKRLAVGADGAVMGRSRECEIVLNDPNVSRRHAEIRPRGGGWVLNDLGSTNGVSVNGVQVDRAKVLSDGDDIELGTTRVTFELS
jgi:FhaA, N-terminal domain/FHA domain